MAGEEAVSALAARPGRGGRAAARGPVARRAAALFLLLVVVYSFSIGLRASRGAAITGDEPFYLLTTQSLLEDGDLDLRQQYRRQSYRSFFDHPEGLWMQSVPTPDGRILSPHNPGLSVLLIPGFALAGLRGAQAELLLLAALAFALTYLWVARVTGEAAWSWWATLAVAAGATPFVYATEIYPEVPAALALVAALLLLPAGGATGAGAVGPCVAAAGAGQDAGTAQASGRPGACGSGRTRGPAHAVGPGRALALAMLLAAMLWLGIKYAPLAALVAGAAFLRGNRRARAVLVVAAAVLGAVYVAFHLRVFGALTPYTVNVVYAGDSTPEVLRQHVTDLATRFYRLWGLFVDRRFGVARWAPVLFLALPGWAWLARRPGTPRLALALILAQHLMATFVAITMMGWWFPGRTLMTVLPLYALPLAAVLQRGGRGVRGLFAGLAVLSAFITADLARAVYAGQVTVAVDPFAMPAALFQGMGPFFPDYRAWTPATTALTVAWLAVLLGGLAWGGRLAGRGRLVDAAD